MIIGIILGFAKFQMFFPIIFQAQKQLILTFFICEWQWLFPTRVNFGVTDVIESCFFALGFVGVIGASAVIKMNQFLEDSFLDVF